jgi:dTDP-4-dehydrorhamnose reductase
MSKRIVVLGERGQIGSEIVQLLHSANHQYWSLNGSYGYYNNPEKLRMFMNEIEPEIIINCAAYTNVAAAEEFTNHRAVTELNIQLPKNLTDIAAQHNAEIVHFSTDYVYDGKKNEYYETDRVKPLNNYGLTKGVGDRFVLEYPKSKVFRVQAVYSNRNSNFFKSIKAKALLDEQVSVVADQFTTPTSASWIANQVYKTLFMPQYGLYHLSPKGFCTFADFAEWIYATTYPTIYNKPTLPVKRILYKELNASVNRPMVTILNHKKFNSAFFPITETWEDVYREFIENPK